MAAHYQKLDGQYTPALMMLVRGCLALDPLARPGSLFALQKALQEMPAGMAGAAPAPPSGTLARMRTGLLGLAARLGLGPGGRPAPDHNTQQ